MRFLLQKGHTAFSECIEILKNTSPGIPPLTLTEEIKLIVPDLTEEHMKYDTKLKILKQSYPSRTIELNIDISYPLPELILTLQLIDDNKFNGRRRNNILNSSFRNLGVSIKKAKGRHYTIYLTFSN